MIQSIVVAWKRPQNIPLIIESIRRQSVPSHITICACNQHDPVFALSQDVLDSADSVHIVPPPNQGPLSRLLPVSTEFEYAAFFVDDHLAGPRFLECLLDTAKSLDGKFATLGMQGRNVAGESLSTRPIKASDSPVPTDCIVTSELVHTKNVQHAFNFRDSLLKVNPSVSTFEDDLILCMGVQHATGYPSYVAPCPSVEHSWRMRILPAPHALCARPDHRSRRDEFVRTAVKVGWSTKR